MAGLLALAAVAQMATLADWKTPPWNASPAQVRSQLGAAFVEDNGQGEKLLPGQTMVAGQLTFADGAARAHFYFRETGLVDVRLEPSAPRSPQDLERSLEHVNGPPILVTDGGALRWEIAAWDRPQTGDRLSLNCGPRDKPCAITIGPPRHDSLNTPELAARAGNPPPRPGPFTTDASPSDIMDAYPKAALQAGKAGAVTLHCQVAPFRNLEGCAVTKETPNDAGFSEAAMKLAARYTVKPAIDGKPSSGREMDIPIAFAVPPPPPRTAPIKAGQWSGTFGLNTGSPQANAIAAPLLKAVTAMKLNYCVTPEVAARGALAAVAASGCRLENVAVSAGRATADDICREESGEDKRSKLAVDFTPDHMTTRVTLTGRTSSTIVTERTWMSAACTTP